MRKNTTGFSLIEALMTLLVLSIGLLGLGQLHARLWITAGELHTSADAGLLAANLTEIVSVAWLAEAEKQSAATLLEPVIHAEISQYQVPPPRDFLTVTDVDLHWTAPSGGHSLSLETLRNTRLDPLDTRWLLPAN
jgi:Tfp pilus assembly protein PilV